MVKIVHALKGRAHTDRPRERLHPDGKLCFEFVKKLEGVLPLTVELIHKDDDRRISHAADMHELLGLFFDAFYAVNNEDDAVHGRERTVGVLSEILMARRIKEVDFEAVVVEAHDRRGHGYPALTLNIHEIRGSALPDLVRLHCACDLYRAAKKQKLLGEGGLARVGMADNGKGPPFIYFVCVVHINDMLIYERV